MYLLFVHAAYLMFVYCFLLVSHHQSQKLHPIGILGQLIFEGKTVKYPKVLNFRLNIRKQAGAELCQAQDQLGLIVLQTVFY